MQFQCDRLTLIPSSVAISSATHSTRDTILVLQFKFIFLFFFFQLLQFLFIFVSSTLWWFVCKQLSDATCSLQKSAALRFSPLSSATYFFFIFLFFSFFPRLLPNRRSNPALYDLWLAIDRRSCTIPRPRQGHRLFSIPPHFFAPPLYPQIFFCFRLLGPFKTPKAFRKVNLKLLLLSQPRVFVTKNCPFRLFTNKSTILNVWMFIGGVLFCCF